jgi:hypothetical protein
MTDTLNKQQIQPGSIVRCRDRALCLGMRTKSLGFTDIYWRRIWKRSPEVSKAGVEALVADIRTFARYYCAMTSRGHSSYRLAKSTNLEIAAA